MQYFDELTPVFLPPRSFNLDGKLRGPDVWEVCNEAQQEKIHFFVELNFGKFNSNTISLGDV